MNVLIIEDHALVRDGFKLLLQHLEYEVDIVEACDYTSAIASIDSKPDLQLVLLDINLPDINGLDFLNELKHRLPGISVIVISASEETEDIRQALTNGARGYIPKSSSHDVMLNAIKIVLAGGEYAPIKSIIHPSYTKPSEKQEHSEKGDLTARQLEVLQWVIQGKTNKEIAKILGLSPVTVRTHVSLIFKALNANNRAQASFEAAKLGLLE